jgi:hypothetical protein
MAVKYKQICWRCRKNYVAATWRQDYVTCYECQKKEMVGTIKDPKMKRLLNLPEEYYKESSFLRNIKISYLKYGKLTDRQIEVFKEVVKKVKGDSKGKKNGSK